MEETILHHIQGLDFSQCMPIVTGYAKCAEGVMAKFDRGYSEITFKEDIIPIVQLRIDRNRWIVVPIWKQNIIAMIEVIPVLISENELAVICEVELKIHA